MKERILTGWDFIRSLRLIIGLATLAAYFSEHDSFLGLLGVIVTSQAVFNVGCCGSNTCSPAKPLSSARENTSDVIEVSFEEIKVKNLNP